VGGSLNEPSYDDEVPPKLQNNAFHPLLVSAGGSLYASFRKDAMLPGYPGYTWHSFSVVLKLEGSAWTQLGDRMADDSPLTPLGVFDVHSLAVSSSGEAYLCAIRDGLVMWMYRYNAATATWSDDLNAQWQNGYGSPV
jgi:hypothetical protein